jgi:DNA/RNA-binding domain of Phe-tRNA-synthetase-like protein
MKFVIAQDVFAQMEDACFGVVVASGIDNQGEYDEVAARLADSIQAVGKKLANTTVKQLPELAPYRDAFGKLGINPNKYPSSIEAMISRIEKGKGFPAINAVVDLGNAVSLKYLVPLGAHDMDCADGDVYVRFSRIGDSFVPFGSIEEEVLPEGELIYSVGNVVKTRRWIWRQSEHGKVTPATRRVFFPIDGFYHSNYQSVIAARDELAGLLQRLFHCNVQVGLVNKHQREMAL